MTEPATFTKVDADRILRRAAEIEGTDDTGPITVDELRSIAGEAGFGSKAVERAIAEVQQAEPPAVPVYAVHRSGFVVTNLSTIRAVPIQISSEQLMRTVRLFQPYREGPAQVKLEEQRISWSDRRGISFSVTSTGGVTEIQVFASKMLIRRGRWMGWVKSAADRLEALVRLVAATDRSGKGAERSRDGGDQGDRS